MTPRLPHTPSPSTRAQAGNAPPPSLQLMAPPTPPPHLGLGAVLVLALDGAVAGVDIDGDRSARGGSGLGQAGGQESCPAAGHSLASPLALGRRRARSRARGRGQAGGWVLTSPGTPRWRGLGALLPGAQRWGTAPAGSKEQGSGVRGQGRGVRQEPGAGAGAGHGSLPVSGPSSAGASASAPASRAASSSGR